MPQPQARKFFYFCTTDAADRLTALYDFVWPSVTALAFARTKAHRHRNLIGEARREALAKTFQSERAIRKDYRHISGLKRANLGKAFLDTAWYDQEQTFARLVLVNVFAIHEGWLDDLAAEIVRGSGLNNIWAKKFVTACQFHYRNSKHEDWAWTITELQQHRSTDLIASFGQDLRSGRFYSGIQMISLLKCYRYFKELRNAIMHKNGKAGQTLVSAFTEYQAVITAGVMQISGSPPKGTLNNITIGSDIELNLYGIVGFSDIILRLMATLDVEAGLTVFGEAAMAKFFSARVNIRSSSGNRTVTLRRMANEYGLPNLRAPTEFGQMLTRNGVLIPK